MRCSQLSSTSSSRRSRERSDQARNGINRSEYRKPKHLRDGTGDQPARPASGAKSMNHTHPVYERGRSRPLGRGRGRPRSCRCRRARTMPQQTGAVVAAPRSGLRHRRVRSNRVSCCGQDYDFVSFGGGPAVVRLARRLLRQLNRGDKSDKPWPADVAMYRLPPRPIAQRPAARRRPGI